MGAWPSCFTSPRSAPAKTCVFVVTPSQEVPKIRCLREQVRASSLHRALLLQADFPRGRRVPTAASTLRSTSLGLRCSAGALIGAALGVALGRAPRRRLRLRATRRREPRRCARGEAPREALALEEVARSWEQAEALGQALEDIANQCALLCCVHRQLGYFAALHEGAVGSVSVVNRAPALPLVVTWEGPGGMDEVYSMNLAATGGATLLQQLLGCTKEGENDMRWGKPGELGGKGLKAKVSLLRTFEEITSNPDDWTPGRHGLWYYKPLQEGGRVLRVYLPEVAQRIAGDKGVQKVLQVLAAWSRGEKQEDEMGLPAGSLLYRFEVLSGACPVANLPTMKRREISREHVQQMLIAQSRILPGEGEGEISASSKVKFAALTTVASSTEEELLIRAFIVPTSGAYSNAQLTFGQGFKGTQPAGLDKVRRIFVLASVWDCYIDGCGLPERRCAWYGKVPLDLVVLERLRSSKAFTEVSVEQDMRERAVEVLLPLVGTCLGESQEFTLVPVLVGGLMSQKAEQYTKLLAPYLADSANLFVVAGDIDELGESLDLARDGRNSAALGAAADGRPAEDGRRWLREVPTLMSQKSRLTPVFDALELFLAVLALAPQREQLTFNRYW